MICIMASFPFYSVLCYYKFLTLSYIAQSESSGHACVPATVVIKPCLQVVSFKILAGFAIAKNGCRLLTIYLHRKANFDI
jgi:hypothetical protein